MRIAFVIYSLGGGGAERVTAVLSRHWAMAGHTVRVMTLAEATENFYDLGTAVEYESLHQGDLSRNLWHAVVSNLSRILVTRRRLKAFNPDVVIGMTSTSSALVALACLGLPCTTIGTERTYPPNAPFSPFRQFVCNLSYRFLNAVVAQTGKTAEWIRSHTLAKATYVIANPLAWPLENSAPFLSPGDTCAAGRSVILAVGRLSPEKDFPNLMEAFSRVQMDYPSWDLVILGSGPDEKLLERKRDQLGMRDRIFFPGRAGNVGDWYKRASIFAMTSLLEGFPNALLEAMGHGLPVISTDCDTGPRDLIEHRVNGLLVSPGDREELTAALRHLMEDGELRQRLSSRASQVVENHAVSRISQQWFDVFSKARGR